MAKLLCFLIVTLALIQTGFGLQCYNCVSSPNSKNCDDLNEKDKVPVVTCGKSSSPTLMAACIKKVIEDKNTKMMNTTRACILTKSDGTADECKAPSDRLNVISCDVCSDDMCNHAAPTTIAVYTTLIPVTLYHIVKHLY